MTMTALSFEEFTSLYGDDPQRYRKYVAFMDAKFAIGLTKAAATRAANGPSKHKRKGGRPRVVAVIDTSRDDAREQRKAALRQQIEAALQRARGAFA
jgi:hypothetical protein